MTAAWFRSTSGGDNPPCHVVGHATAAQRYQAAFVILDSWASFSEKPILSWRKAVSTGPAAISGVPTLRGQEHRLFYRYRGDRVSPRYETANAFGLFTCRRASI